jgi:RNA polymerase sigma-70 factor, ECF subfamily
VSTAAADADAGEWAAVPIEELVSEFGPAMYRVAQSIVGERTMAEDVVQEALLRAWQHIGDYRGDAPLKNWVLRITHNCAVSSLRRRREESRDPMVMGETEQAVGNIDTERTVAGRAAVDGLWVALDSLDSVSRSIVVLREIERMSYCPR